MPHKTILVEDNEKIRLSLIPAMLELGDMEVIAVAETATQAISACEVFNEQWTITVVDLFLKEGNGLTVLRALQSRRADQHVFVLTNYATEAIRQRCLDLGAEAVFDKSTELEAFFERAAS